MKSVESAANGNLLQRPGHVEERVSQDSRPDRLAAQEAGREENPEEKAEEDLGDIRNWGIAPLKPVDEVAQGEQAAGGQHGQVDTFFGRTPFLQKQQQYGAATQDLFEQSNRKVEQAEEKDVRC